MGLLNGLAKIHSLGSRHVNVSEFLLKEIKTLDNPALGKALKQYASVFSCSAEVSSSQKMGLLEDLILKMKMCEDAKIQAEVQRIICGAKGLSEPEINKSLLKAEQLLDSVNVANYNYFNLYSFRMPLGPVSSQAEIAERAANIEKANALLKAGKRKEAEKIFAQIEKGYSETRISARQMQRQIGYLSEDVKSNFWSRFRLEELVHKAKTPRLNRYSRLESIKEFIYKNPEETQMADHLWETYFLSRLKPARAEFLRGINKKYGVKVFYDDKVSDFKLKWLDEEHDSERWEERDQRYSFF